jgi:RNA polymerase sigma-70 factor, ECF subfamily
MPALRYIPVVEAVAPIRCAEPSAEDRVEVPTFDEVYARHSARVWQALRRHGVAETNIDDAVQDVFVVIHRQLPGFEGRSRIETWIYGIVLRVAKDHRRRRERKRDGDPLSDTLPDASPSPAEAAEQSEAAALFVQLLETLDENKRDVFVMCELEGMSMPEMASVLGVNQNTLYSRVRAARAAFEQALRHWQETHPDPEAR